MDRHEHEPELGERLSELEFLVLRSIPNATSVEEIARIAKVPPATLGREIALLQLKGYVAADGQLTEKGVEATKG
jgi:DNA-binding IclR family transcriptional regulator